MSDKRQAEQDEWYRRIDETAPWPPPSSKATRMKPNELPVSLHDWEQLTDEQRDALMTIAHLPLLHRLEAERGCHLAHSIPITMSPATVTVNWGAMR